MKRVHAFKRAGCIGLAAQGIEALEQRLAIREAVHGDALQHHVLLGRSHGSERRVRSSEEAGAGLVVRPVGAGVAQTHERRHGAVDRPLQLGHRGAELRPAARRILLSGFVAVEDLHGIMIVLIAHQRADNNKLVHDLRQLRKGFADLNARNASRDRLPRPGDFLWGIGLQIEHVLMRRAADQVNQDYGLVRGTYSRGRLCSEKMRQVERAESQPECTDTQELPPWQTVWTHGLGRVRRHWRSPKAGRKVGGYGWELASILPEWPCLSQSTLRVD